MAGACGFGRSYMGLGMVLVLVAAGSAAIISSCGSGGGGSSSNGELCQQCGDDPDGPCQTSVTVSGSDAEALCAPGEASCDVALSCLRKLGSAQRRCFPADVQFEAFECDGARANRSATATPTPTLTATPTPTASSTSSASGSETPATPATPGTATLTPTPQVTSTPTGLCGNGVLDGDEECDGSVIDNSGCSADVCTCEDFCDDAGGTLSCNADCTVNFSACTAGGCSF